jgi:hypothetical protein
MGVRMDQCLDLKTKARDDLHDAFRMPARIENVATAGLSVSKHCAVALKRANGKAFMDDGHRVTLSGVNPNDNVAWRSPHRQRWSVRIVGSGLRPGFG